MFHVDEDNKKVAEEDERLDCDHTVKKGEIYYDIYANDPDYSLPVMAVCKYCVIVDVFDYCHIKYGVKEEGET